MLYTRYEADQALMNTGTKKVMLGVFLLILALIPLGVLPVIDFMSQPDWLRLLSEVSIFAIGALGLNILTGLAGQISLGHAFFMGIGAYTAAWLGAPVGPLLGLNLPIWIWLPAAGIVAALIGVAVGPTAVRVRGLYLAFVTLGLVFVGEYVFRNWASLTGGSQSGRTFPAFELKLWKEETPLVSFNTDGPWFGIDLTAEAKTYYFLAVLAILFVILAKKLGSRIAEEDIPAIPQRGHLSGADIEGMVGRALRVSILAGADHITRESLAAVVAEFMPSTQGLERELQETAAILECTDRQFLPPAILQKTEAVGGRAGLQERLTALKQLVRNL